MVNIQFEFFFKVLQVLKITDGDTVKLEIDQGFGNRKVTNIRMMGYDAPETYRPINEIEREAGYKVKEFLMQLVMDHVNNLFVWTEKADKYGDRWDGYLFYKDQTGQLQEINEQVQTFMETEHLTKDEVRNAR